MDMVVYDVLRRRSARFARVGRAEPEPGTNASEVMTFASSTIQYHFCFFVSVGSLVFGKKKEAFGPFLDKSRADSETGGPEEYPAAVRVCQDLGAFRRLDRISGSSNQVAAGTGYSSTFTSESNDPAIVGVA
jgi:hypothetical protein